MIEFRPKKVDRRNNNTPILKDSEIDELAEMVLQDYKPQLLKNPSKIDYMHFLEFYLQATVEFQYIYHKADTKPILGATAFNDELLRIFDREKMCVREIVVNSRTVVIDNTVMEDGTEGLAMFTGLHEGGHLWLHNHVFMENEGMMPLFGERELNSVVCCRTSNIQSFGHRKKLKTALEWREHQADYFAAAIAMPKATFVPFAKEVLKSEGIRDDKVMIGVDDEMDWFAKVEFPGRISEVYGVSKQAAFIRLQKSGFIVDRKGLI